MANKFDDPNDIDISRREMLLKTLAVMTVGPLTGCGGGSEQASGLTTPQTLIPVFKPSQF